MRCSAPVFSRRSTLCAKFEIVSLALATLAPTACAQCGVTVRKLSHHFASRVFIPRTAQARAISEIDPSALNGNPA
jgi:hypothetical protein